MDSVVKGKCQSSLGKRKVQSLTGLPEAEISINLATSWNKLQANCWLRDNEGRELGLVLDESTLRELHEKLGKAIQRREELATFGVRRQRQYINEDVVPNNG